jgi:hypothetical protein
MRYFRVSDSSQIEQYGYSALSQALVIHFKGAKNGTFYRYEAVPAGIFEEFKESTSKGSFLHARIKDQFKTVKVWTSTEAPFPQLESVVFEVKKSEESESNG